MNSEKTNPKIIKCIERLLNDMRKIPYTDIGKPEPLTHELSGLWSRRIDQEHRLIYSYDPATNALEIQSCKGHYS